jgi:hypothetical protein
MRPGIDARVCWIVELVLPQQKFECRPLVTSRVPAEMDLEAHDAVATLMAWKPIAPRCAGAACFPIFPVPEPELPACRFLMAHFSNAAAARRTAQALQSLLPRVAPPWSETTRAIFMHHAREHAERS